MAHNTRPLKRAQDGVAPQYYNPTTDEYEVLHGTAGANHVVIYGPDGQPAALATEAKLEAVRLLLQTLDGKDFATQTTLAQVKQVLDALSGAVSTSSKQDALNIAVEDLKSELILVKSELANIKANQLSGDQKVQLSGTIMELYGATIDERPPANSVPVGATYMAVNTQDVWQSNGTDWVVM